MILRTSFLIFIEYLVHFPIFIPFVVGLSCRIVRLHYIGQPLFHRPSHFYTNYNIESNNLNLAELIIKIFIFRPEMRTMTGRKIPLHSSHETNHVEPI